MLVDEEDDWKIILYSPLMVVGYKHLIDIMIIKGVLDVAFRSKSLKWTSAKVPEKREPELRKQART